MNITQETMHEITSDAADEDDEAFLLAALQRTPTDLRSRTTVFRNDSGQFSLVNVEKLDNYRHKEVLKKIINAVNGDADKFFIRVKKRFDAVDLEFPKVEVRFQNLDVNAYIHVGSRSFPTIPNFIWNMTEDFLSHFRLFAGKRKKFSILKNVSGILRPSRLTLLLGSPSSGKTTFLLALAGRLKHDLKMSGEVTYNGHDIKEFVPQRTSAYASQQDLHSGRATVRETLEFSGRCQGLGYKPELLMELLRREKDAGIYPEEDVDLFIKAIALGKDTSLIADYVMKILGLDVCADTLVGDELRKGISGDQKRRLTTGELLMGASRVLLMDEISTGLDCSTTHQIIKYLRHATHALDGTTLVSLLQPDPETYELFDDIILLSEGQVVYQGPREAALDFFSSMGFKCPPRKNVSDFLQEVISQKDQGQYWFLNDQYRYVSVAKFVEGYHACSLGRILTEELSVPFDRRYNHPAALSMKAYGVTMKELLKISFSWQLLLLKRSSFDFISKCFQLLLTVSLMTSVFFRTTMHHKTLDDGVVYLGAIYFVLLTTLYSGFMEVPMLIAKLPVLYKHRDARFYPCWTYTIPSWLLSIPVSFLESGIWVAVTYFVVDFDPQMTRCLRQFFLYCSLHQMSIALFRLMASLGRSLVVANALGSFAMLVVITLGGFVLSRDRIPDWWIWGYWFSPLMYAQNAASVDEFLGHSWHKDAGYGASLGETLLKVRSFFAEKYWYWIGVGALLGYTILYNVLLALSLTYLNSLGSSQAVVSKEQLPEGSKEKQEICSDISVGAFSIDFRSYEGPAHMLRKQGTVLPFMPLTLTFSNICYYVNVPMTLKKKGMVGDRLQLLDNVTGSFRPGILTTLVGISGSGKTTLMDVLAGRKTGGYIEGSIHVSGFPKIQETFARVSGYCEQNDILCPCLTVKESLVFSAWLRLSSKIALKKQREYVDEVMELVELIPLRGALVGQPGINGLSTEQRKRLTIAIELVSNPSIVFMDELTSGLDARAIAIVMRTLRNIVDTGRTIVCTIHQPSIDIFESFDEIFLMKQGGKLIYSGPLGRNSCKLIQYFEAIKGVPRINHGCNPAAWILEVTSPAEEIRLGLDFAEIYRRSALFEQNKELVDHLSQTTNASKELRFPRKYSKSFISQFLACLYKQLVSYWRNPQYTAVRFFYTVIISLMFGTICWKFGSRREIQKELFNAMGCMYSAVLYIGVTNAMSVQPVVAIERSVAYRERAAGMYSAVAFAFGQVAIEFPHVFVQTLAYSTIFYFMASFELNLWKLIWYMYFVYCTFLYFTFFGMMMTAVTPNQNVADILGPPFYLIWDLFSGFIIFRKRIPIWWRWYCWVNPLAWTWYGLITSQYGDVDTLVQLADGVHSVTVKQLVQDQFGYMPEFLPIAGVMVAAFCLMFAVTFVLAIKFFNFQRRQ